MIACEEFVRATDKKLKGLGVRMRAIDETPGTVESWKRAAEMYSNAWLRELGGRLVPKAHFIDALVLTTKQLRERAERAPPAKESTCADDY